MLETIHSKAWDKGFKISLSIVPFQKGEDISVYLQKYGMLVRLSKKSSYKQPKFLNFINTFTGFVNLITTTRTDLSISNIAFTIRKTFRLFYSVGTTLIR